MKETARTLGSRCECLEIEKAATSAANTDDGKPAGRLTKQHPYVTGVRKECQAMRKTCKNLRDLDDIQFQMKCAIDLVDAVHEAMLNGSCAAEHYCLYKLLPKCVFTGKIFYALSCLLGSLLKG